MAEAYQKFGLSCPSGGSFYICQNNATEFIGCCTTNPCTAANGGRCPQSNLRASSFSADTYTDLPRQDCDDERSIQIWYTCKFNKPPFMGCCASNPCANGLCPPSDLRPAKLSGDSELRALFLSPSPTAGGAASATTSAAPATATTTGLSRSAVAGICAGVAAVVLIIVGFIMYKYGWNARRKRDTEEKAAPPSLALNNSAMGPPPGQPSPGLAVADQQYRGKLGKPGRNRTSDANYTRLIPQRRHCLQPRFPSARPILPTPPRHKEAIVSKLRSLHVHSVRPRSLLQPPRPCRGAGGTSSLLSCCPGIAGGFPHHQLQRTKGLWDPWLVPRTPFITALQLANSHANVVAASSRGIDL